MSHDPAASASMAGVINEMKQQQKALPIMEEVENQNDESAKMVVMAVPVAQRPHQAQRPPVVATVVGIDQSLNSSTIGREALGTPIYGDDVNCAPLLKQKFVTQGYKDIPFAVIFFMQLAATFIIAMYNVQHSHVTALDFGHNSTSASSSSSNGQHESVTYVSVAFLLSMALCLTMMVAMRLHAKAYIWGANLLSIFLWFACGIYVLFVSNKMKKAAATTTAAPTSVPLYRYGGGGMTTSSGDGGTSDDGSNDITLVVLAAVFFIFAAINALWLWFARHRIPFAAVLLKQSVKTTMTNWGTFVMSFAQLGLLAIYMVIFSCMLLPTLQTATSTSSSSSSTVTPAPTHISSSGSSSSSGDYSGLIVCVILLIWFWTVQVMVNVVHVTASGSVATWFFAGDDNMPPQPTVASAKRATTTSFGSICFGSLLVAIIQVMRTVLRSCSRRANFIGIVARCLLVILERLMRYFNTYAFTHVAVYGMSYIDAGKATFEMIKGCGWSALFNDNLVYPVINLTCFLDSLIIGVVLGLASYSAVLGVACFLVSYVVHIIMFRVVYSGIVTMFVCTAECEDALLTSNPRFHDEVQVAKRKFLGDRANSQTQNRNVWV